MHYVYPYYRNKRKILEENSALYQRISNWKSTKCAVVDWHAAENSIFMVSFPFSFM
jgi:hypothetical protein